MENYFNFIYKIEKDMYVYIIHFLVFIALPAWFPVFHLDISVNVSAILLHCCLDYFRYWKEKHTVCSTHGLVLLIALKLTLTRVLT